MNTEPTNKTAPGLQGFNQIPEGVAEAASLIAALDTCLLVGFGRLGAEQAAGLSTLGQTMARTPLAEPLERALAALKANEFQPLHFAALATVRGALQGARYDALLAQASGLFGRVSESPSAVESAVTGHGSSTAAVLCDSTRHWLMELAITGFKQLDASTLMPFSATLENLQADATLGRLACLLSGFQQELLGALPIGKTKAIPASRWSDLWSAAMIATLRVERGTLVPPTGEKVSGTLTVLGVDLRQHGYFVSADVYALLERSGGNSLRVVRITICSYKVDALQGREVWRCLAAGARDGGKQAGDGEVIAPAILLLKAISNQIPLNIKDMTLLPNGDLIWIGAAAEGGKRADIFAVAGRLLAPGAATRFPTVAAADRHPVQLAEPVFLQGVRVEAADGTALRVLAHDGSSLAIALNRLPPTGELTRDDVAAADTIIGLLRFDGGVWQIQPLAVRPGGVREKEARAIPVAFVGSDALDVATKKPKKGEPNTLVVLQERASRLLRKKA